MKARWLPIACILSLLAGPIPAAENAAPSPAPPVGPTGSASGLAAPVTPISAAAMSDEELSRRLVSLKASRAESASRLSASDPHLAELDEEILALRRQIAGRVAADADSDAVMDRIAAAAPVFPRIVDPAADTSALPENPDDSADDAKMDNSDALDFHAPANVIARAALARRISLHADSQPFAAVLDSIRTQTGDNIAVNWSALQAAGIDRNVPVTATLTDLPANRALAEVLAIVAGDAAHLHYILDGGIVTISTGDDLDSTKYQMVKVYDIRDMLDFQSGAYPESLAGTVAQDRINGIIDTIKSTVEPDSWRDNGGSVGSIRDLNGQLIVNQTGENQEAVARLLAQLRGR